MRRMRWHEIDTAGNIFLPERLFLLGCLGPEALFLLSEFRGQLRAEVIDFEDPANFNFGFSFVGIWAALDPFDGFFHRTHLPQPETGDKLLGFAEGTVDYGAFGPG